MNKECTGGAAFLELLYTEVWFLFQLNPFGKLYCSGFILHMQQEPVCLPWNGKALLQDVCTEWGSLFVYATASISFV
jgi:hypothetical protein